MHVYLGLFESENCFQESCLRAAHVAVISLSSLFVKKKKNAVVFCLLEYEPSYDFFKNSF